ncbi:MAG: histidine phosphotransferase family protein [Alkalilacustris sp.]
MEDIVAHAIDKDDRSEGGQDLAALIGSRICHDLTSPLGAIANGLELLELGGQTGSPEMALIAQSVSHAKARVQFLRVAFGAAGAGHRMGGAELAGIVGDHVRGGRVQIDWPAGADVPRPEAKLAFLVLMCLETALPFGGRIAVVRDGGRWHFEAEAERMRDQAELWSALTGQAPMPDLAPPKVQFPLAAEMVARLGRRIVIEQAPGQLRITA